MDVCVCIYRKDRAVCVSPPSPFHTHTNHQSQHQPHPNKHQHSFTRFETLAYARTAAAPPSPTSPTPRGGSSPQRAPARRVVRLVFSGGKEGKRVELTEMSWPLLAFHAPRGTRGVVLGR